jgi:hypothetical protein
MEKNFQGRGRMWVLGRVDGEISFSPFLNFSAAAAPSLIWLSGNLDLTATS